VRGGRIRTSNRGNCRSSIPPEGGTPNGGARLRKRGWGHVCEGRRGWVGALVSGEWNEEAMVFPIARATIDGIGLHGAGLKQGDSDVSRNSEFIRGEQDVIDPG